MKLAICLLAAVTCVHADADCVKFKHQGTSEAESMKVNISNNFQSEHSLILPDNSYNRFNITDFQELDLVTNQQLYDWADGWHITLTVDEIFPKVDGYIVNDNCTCVPAAGRAKNLGNCTEGGCCIFTLQAHATYTDCRASLSIIARASQMGMSGNREVCVCTHEFELFPIPCGIPIVCCNSTTQYCGLKDEVCEPKKDDEECCYLDKDGNPRHEMCLSGDCHQSRDNLGQLIPNHFEC